VRERLDLVTKSGGRLKISAHEDDNRIDERAVAAKAEQQTTPNPLQ
jgi:hypothetical protein